MGFWSTAICDFITHSLLAVTCLMCTLLHSPHLGKAGTLSACQTSQWQTWRDKGFSFVESDTPGKALWELTDLTFSALISSSHVDWGLHMQIHSPPASFEGLVRTQKEEFRCPLTRQAERPWALCCSVSALPVPMDSVTANIYLTNGLGWRVRLFASRQLSEMIKFEQ